MIMITDEYNLRYYTGFRGGEGIAFTFPDGENYLIVDSRYTEAAKQESDFTVIEYNKQNPLKDIIKDIVLKRNVTEVAFEDKSIVYADLMHYKGFFDKSINFVPLGDALLKKRQVKNSYEIEMLAEAEAIGDRAFNDILGIIRPGLTEKELAAELEYRMKKHGAEGFSFDTICASGLNSSMPHAIPGDKLLENGDFVTMDFGCIYKGYCSDMTRTVVLGKASDEQRKVYEIVFEAQLAGLNAVKAGMRCCDVDKVARDVISSYGYGEYFGHGLGHSVGLYIHESPSLNTRDETVLVPNMIETVEPGVYIPGFGGVRIEDMVVVTEDGCRNLANSPKNLIEI